GRWNKLSSSRTQAHRPAGSHGEPMARNFLPLAQRRSLELRRLRRARYAERIYPLGVRIEFELIEHLIAEFDPDQERVDGILARFADRDAAALHAVGADKLPPVPVHMVRR